MWPDDETPDPAAWINFNAATGERNVSFVCESELASIPLWSKPQRPQRQPLTDEELYKVFPAIATYHEANKTLYRSIARAIEAAHGIKGDT